jgi:hypothetical protein
MSTITQHRPAYVTGFENEVVAFTTTAELLAIAFVAGFRSLDGFYRYSVSRNRQLMLMAELDGGRKWWVVGYLDTDCPDLPDWQPVRAETRSRTR